MAARATSNQGEALAAAAPVPARSAAGGVRRALALVAITASVCALAAVGTFAWRHRVDASGLAAPPFKLAEPAWRSVLTVAAVSDRSCPASTALVILYVSSTCSHCKAELERWSKLVRTQSPQLSCVGIVVAAAPGRVAPPSSWLPKELSTSLLWDHDRDLAKELGVRLVPLAAFVTQEGVVISTAIGEASEDATARRLAELRRASVSTRGARKND